MTASLGDASTARHALCTDLVLWFPSRQLLGTFQDLSASLAS